MTTTTVGSTAGLMAALGTAHAGDTILLSSGSYSNVQIQGLNFATPVNIMSADPTHLAVLKDLNVQSSSGVNFSHLELSTVGTPLGGVTAKDIYPFTVLASQNISFDSIVAHGDPNGTLATTTSGMVITDSNGVSITNSSFQYFHDAIEHIDSNNINISNNAFQYMYDDSIRGGGTSNITIDYNTFTSNHMVASDPDHPDCIQLWTVNTVKSASNITIIGNNISRGSGNATQGIFLTNQINMPFLNVNIQGNTVSGELARAISIGDAPGALVTNNVIQGYSDQKSGLVIDTSAKAVITGNKSTKYTYMSSSGLVISNNTTLNYITAPAFVPWTPGAAPAVQAAAPMMDMSTAPFASHMAGMVSASSASAMHTAIAGAHAAQMFALASPAMA